MADQQNLIFGILISEKSWHSHYVRALLATADAMGVKALRMTPEQLQQRAYKLLPTVVYNRISTRKEESDQVTRAAKGWLDKQQIPYFNGRFFNKREVDRLLRNHPATASYLPASWYFWEAREMENKLSEYGALYLKPISGSLGEGICRLEKRGSRFLLEMRNVTGVEIMHLDGKKELYTALRKKIGHQQWIIQEEIPLRTYHDRKTDFRVHVQRQPDGEFVVTGYAAKVAAKGAVTTHVHSGGSIVQGTTVLNEWFHDQAGAAYDALAEAALMISRRLSQKLDPRLGELGLDMGFSNDGRLVVFEANAKPGRAIFYRSFLRQANLHSMQLLIQYAQSLDHSEWKTADYRGVVVS